MINRCNNMSHVGLSYCKSSLILSGLDSPVVTDETAAVSTCLSHYDNVRLNRLNSTYPCLNSTYSCLNRSLSECMSTRPIVLLLKSLFKT